MKRILITGAEGFIGGHCLQRLLASGEHVHATTFADNLPDSRNDVQWHTVDVLNKDQIAALMKSIRPTHLLHLAWNVQTGMQLNAVENFRWVNAGVDLFRLFHQNGGKRVVVAGSCAEYDWRFPYLSESTTPVTPANLYGSCKHALQTLLDAYCRLTDLRYAWARIFFTYGPGENPKRLVASVIRSLLRGQEAPCSHGEQIRDYLYAGDIADALVVLLDDSVQGPINIGSGEPVKLKQIIQKTADLIGADRDLVRLGAISVPDDEPPVLLADIHRLKHELGWKPKYDLDVGLTETIAWWKPQLVNGLR
ncbi:CDP-4-dehydro-6-deoxy-D-gulose 4-reductase [Desulfosarcina ovata subsp. sediminis]|uniref:CDP-4-dehydro-6-deoxy-D-gulose 4-reductase n=1 Tax=Desulfosarcina ovata subsp. sediminis TaxID=885957 RepID=A0A5K7ZPU7_9BACT|nr:NAD(P)-dependent oxidoreductase [Desulfosarcina ovata]BBO82787.1 CDP-4-dehydro-6-deoxy-D-gulose 4-reductase [Desulfosarcina ovata subsp. sediminis]